MIIFDCLKEIDSSAGDRIDNRATLSPNRRKHGKALESMGEETLEKQIAKMINRQLANENKKFTQQISLLQDSTKEIRDYAKEEAEKVREEMQ